MNPGEIENEIAAIEEQIRDVRETDQPLHVRLRLVKRLRAQIDRLKEDKAELLKE